MKTNEKVVHGLFWRFLERSGAQGVSFFVSIILARLLDPSVYGTVALVTIFTTILQVFIDSGLGNALIQKKDVDNLDFSSVFYFNIFICVVLYFGLFCCAPLIAAFFEVEELTSAIRVLGLTLIISGVKNVQQAYVSKNMLFKKFFFATLGGTIGAAIIGIYMALRGYGVWALITQNLFNQLVDTIILWATVHWRPSLSFSFERLKQLIRYGSKLLFAALVDTIYKNLRSLIIGKRYTSENLAFYNKGQKFPELIVSNINSSIDSVLFPVMSESQNQRKHVKAMTRRSIAISTYIMMPIMMGLAICAEPIISILLTEKWLPAVFFMRCFCFSYAFYPVHTANLNAIKALGRSDIYLKLEIIKKIIGLTLVIITMCISVEAMAITLVITSITSQVINSFPNKKLLDYSYFEQMRDIFPQLLLTTVMGASIYIYTLFNWKHWITLTLQIVTGVIIYIAGSLLFKIESLNYAKSMVFKHMPKFRKKS